MSRPQRLFYIHTKMILSYISGRCDKVLIVIYCSYIKGFICRFKFRLGQDEETPCGCMKNHAGIFKVCEVTRGLLASMGRAPLKVNNDG